MITTPDGNTVEGYFRYGKQIAKEDTAAIEEVLRDIRSLGEEVSSIVNQDKPGENSTPASVGSTQPTSTQSSGDNIVEAYISIQKWKE
ncbi:hypothetical protein LSM04_005591 [Trypanosoma melophagium]|uniref:uncharacterized protein n=1 Tax=Trypanosoma melophagium TaxID=715481 RepID=UPI003519EB9F|nr:hypothetical protein LSM04_005591 [Trypanosoma melophagium]